MCTNLPVGCFLGLVQVTDLSLFVEVVVVKHFSKMVVELKPIGSSTVNRWLSTENQKKHKDTQHVAVLGET